MAENLLVVAFVVIVLVLLNGLFVAAEFAIIATPRTTAMAAAGRRRTRAARRVHEVARDPRRQDLFIATAQAGITVASLGLGMYGEHALAEWLVPRLETWAGSAWLAAHTMATILAITLLTYLHIVFGEMIPKALALQRPLETALAVSAPMAWVKRAAFPLVVALNATGNGILRLVGIRREITSSHYHSAEEIGVLVEESQRGGLLREEETRLVQEALRFTELNAGEAMVPRVLVTGIPIHASREHIRATVREHPYTRYPVYSGDLDHILGFVHVRVLLRADLEQRSLEVGDLGSIPFIPLTTPLEDVLETLRAKRSHMAVVMDEHGGTAGIITMEDLLEEVVGEYGSDASATVVKQVADARWTVAGTLRLDELEERVGVEVGHEEVYTVSGLILTCLERPPLVGDVVRYAGLRFEVVSVAGNGVRSCVVSRLEDPDPAETG